MIGKTINQYKILSKLGVGGMGVVYKALDTKLDRHVALKFLPQLVSEDEVEKKRFVLEAKSASAIQHQNICTIYDIAETNDGQLFISMEYYEGHTLKETLEEGPLSLDMAMSIARQVAQGLSKAHRQGIVHRDIKPANIIVTTEGVVKILDFGLAKLVGKTRLTKTGGTVGTVAYMSPEQGKGENVDQRTDIWSLTAVLFEMISGEPPFNGEYEQAIIYSILNEEPDLLSDIVQDVTEALARVVQKGLAKHPDDRYEDVDRLIDDLENVDSSTATARSATLVNRKKRGVFALGIVGTLLTLTILVISLQFSKKKMDAASGGSDKMPKDAVVVLPFTIQGKNDTSDYGEGMVTLLSMNLDGVGNLRTVDHNAVLSFLRSEKVKRADLEIGKRAAEKFRADGFILGSIIEAGGILRIIATHYKNEVDYPKIAEASSQGADGDFIEIVNNVSAQLLLPQLGESAIATPILRQTSQSLPAISSYLEGEKALRDGDFQLALEAFQTAVEEDSTFALAWFRVSRTASEWLIDKQVARNALSMAKRYSSRLSDHERLYLEAFEARFVGNQDKAMRLYRRIVADYPEDSRAWRNIGTTQLHSHLYGKDRLESRLTLEQAIKLEPQNAFLYHQLCAVVLMQNKLSEFDSLMRRVLELSPGHAWTWPMIANRTIMGRDESKIQKILQEADYQKEIELVFAADQHTNFEDDPIGSELLAPLLIQSSRSAKIRGRGHVILARSHLGRGKLDLAESELQLASELDPELALVEQAFIALTPFIDTSEPKLEALVERLKKWDTSEDDAAVPYTPLLMHRYARSHIKIYLLGLLSARLGKQSEALGYAKALEQMEYVFEAGSLANDFAIGIRAELAMQEGENETAVQILETARMQRPAGYGFGSPFYARLYQRWMRAELLHGLGRLDEALSWYDSVGDGPSFKLFYLVPAYLRRGKILVDLGQKDKAIDYLTKVIELWKDCDAELEPFVNEAQQQIRRLSKPNI